MTDPIKALADAARNAMNHWCPTHCDSAHFVCPTLHPGKSLADCTCGAAQEFAKHAELSNALAAYDAAQVSQPPSDAEIEAAMNAVEEAAYDHGIAVVQGFEDTRPLLERRHEACDAARILMRRASPDAGLLRAAKELLKDTHPSNRDNFIVSNYVVDDLRAEVARVEGK